MSYLTVSDGTRLRLSQRGAGPAVVLIHGWKMSHRAWDKAIVGLSRRFRVIAYDLRGMGESDKPDSSYDFTQHAADLAEVLEALELRDVTMVGWSMGCTVLLSYLAGQHRASRAVLLNGPIKLVASADWPHGITEDYLEQVLERLIDAWPEAEREFMAETFHRPHPECVDWFTRIALQTPLDVIVSCVRHQQLLDLRPVVADVNIPLLAMYGRHDPYYSIELAHWIARTAKQGRHVIFEGSAHCPPVEETTKFVAALTDFIEQNPGPAS